VGTPAGVVFVAVGVSVGGAVVAVAVAVAVSVGAGAALPQVTELLFSAFAKSTAFSSYSAVPAPFTPGRATNVSALVPSAMQVTENVSSVPVVVRDCRKQPETIDGVSAVFAQPADEQRPRVSLFILRMVLSYATSRS